MKLTKNELYALHYADHQTIEQIAEHCPAASPQQMKKILAMSERKYQMQKNSSLIQESDVQETAVVYPYGWRRAFAAAACLLICTGTFGGIYSLNRLGTVVSEDMQTAELDFTEETQDTTENMPEKNQEKKEVALFRPESEQNKIADNQKKSANHTKTEENGGTIVSSKNSDSENTSVQSHNEQDKQEVSPKILSNVVPVQVNAQAPAEELPAESPAEAPVQMGLVWTELSCDERGYPIIPGFRIVDDTEYASSSDENARYLVPDSLDGAENRVLTMELPAYLPSGITVNSDDLKSAESYYISAMSQNEDIWQPVVTYDVDSSYFTGNSSYCFEFRKRIKRAFANIVCYEQGKGIFKPFTYDGKNGYVYYDMDIFRDYSIVWDRGDYIFQIETYDLNGADDHIVEEIIEMLVSAAPHDTSADPVAENLPEIPGFTVQSGYLNAADQNYWLITADHLTNAPAEVYTDYVPAYVPTELYSDFEGWQYIEDWYEAESRRDGLPRRTVTTHLRAKRNPEINDYYYGGEVIVKQIVKNDFQADIRFDENMTVTPMTIAGNPAFEVTKIYEGSGYTWEKHSLYWDEGDYIFLIEFEDAIDSVYDDSVVSGIPDNWRNVITKIAESVQPVTDNTVPIVDGFHIQNWNGDVNTWHITSASTNGATALDTIYDLTYLPDGFYFDQKAQDYEDFRAIEGQPRYTTHYRTTFETYYQGQKNDEGSSLELLQCTKSHYSIDIQQNDSAITPVKVGEYAGFVTKRPTMRGSEYYTSTFLVWDNGEYVFNLIVQEMPDDFLDELIKIAESVKPVTE
ncbi:MAG: DUF4367 domain-containing protein [Oscillospiraceae bacterium]|nr:DUF4367 domain-containing protein [Oscillospiraceae bacterium]